MASVARQALKLYVGNLPWTIGTQELKSYFSKYGHVNTASVVFNKTTGLSKNYGFVVYSNKEGFDNATNISSHSLEGHSLKVEPANLT